MNSDDLVTLLNIISASEHVTIADVRLITENLLLKTLNSFSQVTVQFSGNAELVRINKND